MELIPRAAAIAREPDMTPREFLTILAHVPAPVQCVFESILILGCRNSEFCQLDESDLRYVPGETPEQDVFEVRILKRAKTRTSYRVVPVDPAFRPLIVQAVRLRTNRYQVAKWWAAACDAAGMSRYVINEKGKRVREAPRVHDLRHALIQWLTDEHVDTTAIMRYVGHATHAMTARYQARKLRREVARKVRKVVPIDPKRKAV